MGNLLHLCNGADGRVCLSGAKSDAPMADVTESNVQTTQVDGQSRGLQGAENCRQLLTAVFQVSLPIDG